ncbi:Pkinase-domain-containing protein [Auriculariales sp. MPI-PUGE-AT-0066]|nr:Pkinase-domain-containing protein [Auriculariales sp. MPI-PUGE-AT-0066]
MLAMDEVPDRRPSSVAVPANTSRADSQRRRVSHAPASSASQNHSENAFHTTAVRDVYSHPAAVAFQAAHPRRTIPRFGPYLLLQTIGEGEFGKVKLGLHQDYGEEVAVKLIRRGSVDNNVRMSKVEREIDVLKVRTAPDSADSPADEPNHAGLVQILRHPNIVRLFDVIETDKYIGIVLEYASGGELFDHILAHRCLKEKDACRLFSQLISGVSYIHAKKIVHRDLKLENLLLDRNRNVIISDFGFANRFEHHVLRLALLRCPELVISEGMYVGSAVDIWSCGVILYAMLAGYLPFDDDPANPDGDNINLLYKYIINTPLTFPDYISDEARDLLSKMLVPDPTLRASLQTIKDHRWLRAYKHYFERSIEEHEQEALVQHQQKREEYARKLKIRNAPADDDSVAAHHREHRERRHRERGERGALADLSTSPTAFAGSGAVASDTAIASHQYTDMDVDNTASAQRRAHAVSAIVMPTQGKRQRSQPSVDESITHENAPPPAQVMPMPADDATPHKEKKKRAKTSDRHTIKSTAERAVAAASSSRPPMPMPVQPTGADVFSGEAPAQQQGKQQRQRHGSTPSSAMEHVFSTSPKQEKPNPIERKPAPSVPVAIASPTQPPVPQPTSTPPVTSSPPVTIGPQRSASVRTVNGKSSRTRASLDRLGFGKMFGSQQQDPAPSVTPPPEAIAPTPPHRTESMSTRNVTEDESSTQDHSTVETAATTSEGTATKSKRMTLLNLVTGSTRTERKMSSRQSKLTAEKDIPPASAIEPQTNGTLPARPVAPSGAAESSGMAASTSKAKKVMDWFRTRSTNRGRMAEPPVVSSIHTTALPSAGSRSAAPQLVITTPRAADGSLTPGPLTADPLATPITPHPGSQLPFGASLSSRIATALSPASRSHSSPMVTGAPTAIPASVPVNAVMSLRVHRGAVDQGTVTTGSPAEVFAHVRGVLQAMGVELQKESEYKYQCVRPKRKKATAAPSPNTANPPSPHREEKPSGVAAYTMVGSASMNGVDKRGLPHPSGMLRGLLTRRASSHISDVEDDVRSPTELPTSQNGGAETIYGDRTTDLGDEVKFSVELTRIDRLDDTLSLDIRRMKGNLRSYKFIYDTLRERCAFTA